MLITTLMTMMNSTMTIMITSMMITSRWDRGGGRRWLTSMMMMTSSSRWDRGCGLRGGWRRRGDDDLMRLMSIMRTMTSMRMASMMTSTSRWGPRWGWRPWWRRWWCGRVDEDLDKVEVHDDGHEWRRLTSMMMMMMTTTWNSWGKSIWRSVS